MPGLDLDYINRPSVRIKFKGKPKPDKVKAIVRRLLEQTKENVRTQLQGRWTPIQWDYQNGKRAGDPAMLGTEDQWMIWSNGKGYRIMPRPRFQKSWFAHIVGMRIRSKSPNKPMRIPFASGTVGLHMVKLPKRDPRPTQAQVDQILKEFR